MGLFGVLITLTAFRRRERWAYFVLWYYPVFWTAHLVGNLPPGKDHIHQIVLIALSLVALLVSSISSSLGLDQIATGSNVNESSRKNAWPEAVLILAR